MAFIAWRGHRGGRSKGKVKRTSLFSRRFRYLLHLVFWLVNWPFFAVNRDVDSRLRSLSADAAKYPVTRDDILFIPSYYHIAFPRLIDSLLALSLRMRGVRLRVLLLSGLDRDQDVIFGGIYNAVRWKKVLVVRGIERKLWTLLGAEILNTRQWMLDEDEKTVQEMIGDRSVDEVRKLEYQGYPVGWKAELATKNLSNHAFLVREEKYEQHLRAHAANIVRSLLVCDRIFQELKPKTIVSEFPHYYRWHVPYFVARRLGIAWYGSVLSEKKNSFFMRENSDDFLDASPAWESFQKKYEHKRILPRVEAAIQARRGRKISHADYFHEQQRLPTEVLRRLEKSENVVFFPVNVLFDLAVFSRSKVFADVVEMIEQLITFAHEHQDITLLMKAHPAERLFYESAYLNAERHCLAPFLRERGLSLPENVLFLDYDCGISNFALYPYIDLGVVYTSSSVIEMGWEGIPVITAGWSHYQGKGLTVDPSSREEFFEAILKVLQHPLKETQKKQLKHTSRVYYELYFGHSFLSTGLIQGNDTEKQGPVWSVQELGEIAPGKNKVLDYICDAILHDKPMFAPGKVPPWSA